MNVFQDDVLANAEEQGFGLLTTWDLFRLTRGFLRNGWRHENVAGLFFRDARVDPVPAHYQAVGVIDGYWEKAGAVGIRLTEAINAGDVLAFELKVDFVEETAASLQLDGAAVERAVTGDHVGMTTQLGKRDARDGALVYRVERA